MTSSESGTRGSTNLFLLATAVVVIGAVIALSGGRGVIFGVSFAIALIVALTGAVVRAIENGRRGGNR